MSKLFKLLQNYRNFKDCTILQFCTFRQKFWGLNFAFCEIPKVQNIVHCSCDCLESLYLPSFVTDFVQSRAVLHHTFCFLIFLQDNCWVTFEICGHSTKEVHKYLQVLLHSKYIIICIHMTGRYELYTLEIVSLLKARSHRQITYWDLFYYISMYIRICLLLVVFYLIIKIDVNSIYEIIDV